MHVRVCACMSAGMCMRMYAGMCARGSVSVYVGLMIIRRTLSISHFDALVGVRDRCRLAWPGLRMVCYG